MLDLKRVRVFYEVAERRSFSAAAEALEYTQPAVSHHVAALEGELGLRLINRGARPLTLTQAGRALHAAAELGLAEFKRAELDLRSLSAGASGRVSIGSVVTGLRGVVPPAVRGFREQFPDLDLALQECQAADILVGLRSGDFDLGIITLGHGAPAPDPAVFAADLLAEGPLLVALPAGHRLAKRKRIDLSQLRDERWLLPARSRFQEFRAEVDALLARAEISVGTALESSDDLAAGRLVAAGLAVGVVPGLGALPLPGVSLVPFRPVSLRRLYAVSVRGPISDPIRVLLDRLRLAAEDLKVPA